jgi:hypothetical protein
MTEQRTGLDYGLIGALADIGFAIVLGSFLAINTNWQGDAAPRPLVIAVLFATPGVIALIGVLAERPWLLIAGSLPLFPAAGLSFTGATLVFLLPAALMVVGAMRMISRPEVPRRPATRSPAAKRAAAAASSRPTACSWRACAWPRRLPLPSLPCGYRAGEGLMSKSAEHIRH